VDWHLAKKRNYINKYNGGKKMRKTVTILFLCIALFIGVTEVKANVYASSVTITYSGTFPATISYNLNQAATEVVITIKDNSDGSVVQTITIAGGDPGTSVGFNDVDWDGTLAAGGSATSGVYTVEILASDDTGSDGYELISFDTGPDSWYWSSSGVASNNRNGSIFFGTAYVTERTGGTSGNDGGIETARGLYLHDSFGKYRGSLQAIAFATGNTGGSGIDWGAGFSDEGSPWGVTVGPDDQVYVFSLASNRDDPKRGGLAVGDGEFSWRTITTILDFSDLSNHNPISDAIVVGEGADRVLYTVEQTGARTGSDNDGLTDGDGFDMAEIKSYAIGATNALFTGDGTVVIPTETKSHSFRIEMDADGYLYIVQQAYDSLALADGIWGLSKWDISGTPAEIWHVELDEAPAHDSTNNAHGTQATNFNGLALDEAGGRVYVTRKGTARPLHNVIVYNMSTGALMTSFVAAQSIVGTDTTDLPGGGGGSIRDVGVDAAGNVMIVNSSFEAFRIYSPPDGPNSYTTLSNNGIDVDNGLVTGLDDSKISTIPQAISLAQNYPNPFNGTTTINYTLANNEDVKLVIYDILGKEVISLVNANQSAGSHSATWFGQNTKGVNVVSGIYFYKISIGSGASANAQSSIIKRMLYLK